MVKHAKRIQSICRQVMDVLTSQGKFDLEELSRLERQLRELGANDHADKIHDIVVAFAEEDLRFKPHNGGTQ